MADFTVSGAGSGVVNGDYTENGTNDSKPAYEISGGAAWIYWSSSNGFWAISDILGDDANMLYADVGFNNTPTPFIGTYDAVLGSSPDATLAAFAVSFVPYPYPRGLKAGMSQTNGGNL